MSCIPYACNNVIGNIAVVMNISDMLRYKNLLLSKRQELSNGKSLVDSIPTAGELRGDPVDMAATETDAAMQIRLHQTDGKLLRAIEDALARIRHGEIRHLR